MRWDNPQRIRPGWQVRLELPYSEVCMHMRVAGKVMNVQMTEGQYPMAQVLKPSGFEFSAPILPCEAGIYGSIEGYYCYPESGPTGTSGRAWIEALNDAIDHLGRPSVSRLYADDLDTWEQQ